MVCYQKESHSTMYNVSIEPRTLKYPSQILIGHIDGNKMKLIENIIVFRGRY